MSMSLLNTIFKTIQTNTIQPKRSLYYWINKQFNSLDVERKKEIGPDLTCAEWILRNGGLVKWKNGFNTISDISDYNEIPRDTKDFHLNEVDASDTNVMLEGFEHFRGCKYIEKLTLHNCFYIDDKALKGLDILKESLKILNVSSCKSVTDNGILNLKTLKKLQTLNLCDLPGVKDVNKTRQTLQSQLPQCIIQFTT